MCKQHTALAVASEANATLTNHTALPSILHYPVLRPATITEIDFKPRDDNKAARLRDFLESLSAR
jgi:hypothetical protein